MPTTNDDLRELLDPLDGYPLECDGFVRAASWLLHREGIDYTVHEGTVAWNGKSLPLHYWITVDDALIDYRLRMWFGDEAPHHGVIDEPDPAVEYGGQPCHGWVANPAIYEILTSRSAYA